MALTLAAQAGRGDGLTSEPAERSERQFLQQRVSLEGLIVDCLAKEQAARPHAAEALACWSASGTQPANAKRESLQYAHTMAIARRPPAREAE
ncbi:MAG TPA: hypothetical protein VJR89_11665 [Polyangiales bacterium]|nr:hypothetical protein [Polyangiales bacterium]